MNGLPAPYGSAALQPPDDLDADDYQCAKCGRSGWSSDPYLRDWQICERHGRDLPLLLTDAHVRQWIGGES